MNSFITETATKFVCKAHTGALCEHCLSGLVISSNPMIQLMADAQYAAQNFFDVISGCHSSIVRHLSEFRRAFAIRKIRQHEHGPEQQICERCIGSLASTGFWTVDEIREWLLYFCRAVGLVCELIAIFVIGIFMIVMTFCPDFMRKKTEEEERELARIQKQKDEDYARILQELEEKNKHLDQNMINKDALLNDDHKVAELNQAIRAVEDGRADPQELQKLADEIIASRREENRKDERRLQLWTKVQDIQFAAARVMADADRKNREGKIEEAAELYERARGMMRDANGFYLEFKSV